MCPNSKMYFHLSTPFRRQPTQQQGVYFGYEESCAARIGKTKRHWIPKNDAIGF